MLTKLMSFATLGLHSEPITVEVGITHGDEPIFRIVGLGDTAVQESKQRVKHAIRSSGFRLPSGRVITVNLAPADIKKIGPRYDLPIALGVLMVHDFIDLSEEKLKGIAFLGELALDGSLRHVSGVLPAVVACLKNGFHTIVVPEVNGPEAALVPGVRIIAPGNFRDMVDILLGEKELPPIAPLAIPKPDYGEAVDFSDVRGQDLAKRALEIAAAGGHNVLMSGAPGSGKTLLAQALKTILPPLSLEESLEVTQIYSIANLLSTDTPLLHERPFRVVHHTASGISIVGGGQIPGPGEISLAHKGVLFLDELAEFPPAVLEVLRQPMEDRRITITRAQGSVTFPADFLLVAAMNPPEFSSAIKIKRRISAPLLDRIDLTIDVQPVPIEDLEQRRVQTSDSSTTILKRVVGARERQRARFKGMTISTNKEISVRDLKKFCPLSDACEDLLKKAATNLHLSARSYHRTIKVSRTIADLAGSDTIETGHVAEALQYRQSIGLDV